MDKQLEETINFIKYYMKQYFYEDISIEDDFKFEEAIKKALNYIENSIPKEKIKNKIKYIQEEGYWEFTTDRDADKCEEILQELLEGK